ncbi:batten's disease protein Cln3 [Trichoderma chlorosporum]
MPAVKLPVRGSGSILTAGWDLRTFTAFGIVGFANALLPYIIFSSLYLIVPFSLPVVLLIELLPAIAVKLLVPHILHYTPRWAWLVLLSSCWTLATIAANAAPPNVIAPIRTLIAVLVSANAAVAEVFFLGQLCYYGKTALAGWGSGTAAGGALRAVLPRILTIHMGIMMRNATGYIYYLVLATIAAYFLILPSSLSHEHDSMATGELIGEGEAAYEIESQKFSLLSEEKHLHSIDFWERVRRNMQLMSSKLLRLCIDPLLLVTAVQVLVSAGTPRASRTLRGFSGYSAFLATYGFAFQIGDLVARSTAVLFRTRRPRLIFALLVIYCIVVILNTSFLLCINAYVVFGLISSIGWLSGMMFMNIYGAAMEYLSRNPEADGEFALGSIGVGETAGILIGSLAGVTFESQLCGLPLQRSWFRDVE